MYLNKHCFCAVLAASYSYIQLQDFVEIGRAYSVFFRLPCYLKEEKYVAKNVTFLKSSNYSLTFRFSIFTSLGGSTTISKIYYIKQNYYFLKQSRVNNHHQHLVHYLEYSLQLLQNNLINTQKPIVLQKTHNELYNIYLYKGL